MRYRLYSLIAVGLVFCSAAARVRGATIDCVPLRPGPQVDSSVEDTIKGQANILLRSLGSGTIENGYRQVQSDTLARYPGADKLLIWREYIYVGCTLLAASSQWSDDDKWDKWMQLMNRWSAAPPTDSAPVALKSPAAADPPLSDDATPVAARLVIGGVGLGTSLAQLQARKDIGLSLDADGNPYGEETFTLTYGPRQLDGDVVFGLRSGVVYSITVTHMLGFTSCADSPTASLILKEQIHDWGTPIRRVVSGESDGTGGQTASYTFRRNDMDMVLVAQTPSRSNGQSACRISLNYQRRADPG